MVKHKRLWLMGLLLLISACVINICSEFQSNFETRLMLELNFNGTK